MTDIGNSYTKLARSAADLCAFMVVCRHGQLSSAAREMRISQPSLSQRIRNLETVLKQTLFERTSKGVVLTRDGQTLFRKLHEPLNQLAGEFQEISEGRRQNRLLISVDFAFAYFWLLPRLPKIRQHLGQVDVCVLTTQDPRADAVDNTDLVIHMGRFEPSTPQSQLLIQEQVSAVCSPDFKACHPHIQNHADLKHIAEKLLHLNSPSSLTNWCTWSEWLNNWDVDTTGLGQETVFNNYEMIIQAAQKGHGIALGWHGLVDELLDSDELVPIVAGQLTTDRGYHISHLKEHPSQAAVELFNWIIEDTTNRT